jgi:hypothetical protein
MKVVQPIKVNNQQFSRNVKMYYSYYTDECPLESILKKSFVTNNFILNINPSQHISIQQRQNNYPVSHYYGSCTALQSIIVFPCLPGAI